MAPTAPPPACLLGPSSGRRPSKGLRQKTPNLAQVQEPYVLTPSTIWLTVETPRQPFSWGLRPSGPIHRLARDHKINCNSPAAKKSLRLRRALALLVPRAQSISRRRSLSPFRRLIFQQSDGLPGTSSDARPAEDACDAACMQWNAHRERTAREGKGRKINGW